MIKKPSPFRIKLFIALSCAFFIFTIVGTLSHEFGHYVVGKYYGAEPVIHYGYTSDTHYTKEYLILDSLYMLNEDAIKAKQPFPAKQLFEETQEQYYNQSLWIVMGGPFQTMVTGTIGFLLLLLVYKKRTETDFLTFKEWFFVFLSLFWLRQTANVMVGWGTFLLTGKTSMRSDEIRIAEHLDWYPHTLELITASIGLGVLAYIVFKVIPLSQRMLFLASGLVGGVTGYLFWLVYVGPVVMP
ncbi:MAG: hypothetical protein V4651_04185 [Bacteroidota bacterium]